MVLESDYQAWLIRTLKAMYPGCIILKNDPEYLQGFPDLTIFYEDKWAVLEVKASEDSKLRPNQAYYVNKLNGMSFAAFIYPENQAEVFYDLQQAFKPSRKTCLPECQ